MTLPDMTPPGLARQRAVNESRREQNRREHRERQGARGTPPEVELPGEDWAVRLADLPAAERTAEVVKQAYRLYEACVLAGDWREARQTLAWLADLSPKSRGAGKADHGSPL